MGRDRAARRRELAKEHAAAGRTAMTVDPAHARTAVPAVQPQPQTARASVAPRAHAGECRARNQDNTRCKNLINVQTKECAAGHTDDDRRRAGAHRESERPVTTAPEPARAPVGNWGEANNGQNRLISDSARKCLDCGTFVNESGMAAHAEKCGPTVFPGGPTRHNHPGASYGRIIPGCPRCAELRAGAPARTGGWAEQRAVEPEKTRHNHPVVFGRREPGCPRCAELDAGAAPRPGRDGRTSAERREHQESEARQQARYREDQKRWAAEGKCNTCGDPDPNHVCTAFQW